MIGQSTGWGGAERLIGQCAGGGGPELLIGQRARYGYAIVYTVYYVRDGIMHITPDNDRRSIRIPLITRLNAKTKK